MNQDNNTNIILSLKNDYNFCKVMLHEYGKKNPNISEQRAAELVQEQNKTAEILRNKYKVNIK